MDSTLDSHRRLWDRYAASDPLWAVLSDPAKQGRRWQLDEFMRNGEREISLLFYQLAQLRLEPRPGKALDFGCGVGRLTQALARRFRSAAGVDISPAMVDIATSLNRHPDTCEYRANPHPDLRDFAPGAFDFIYSNIVLQHIPPELSVGYVAEFLRVLDRDGVLVFQLPSHLDPKPKLVIERMPDEAYRAELTLMAPLPTDVRPGAHAAVAVQVRNLSAHDWRQSHTVSIRAGNHWLDASGRVMLIQDDGRAVLPAVIRAGETAVVMLPMTAPAQEGVFRVEIDLVHEGVTWFHDKGSAVAGFDVRVSSSPMLAGGSAFASTAKEAAPGEYSNTAMAAIYNRLGPEAEPETFPMYGVPKDHVLELIARHGGTVVHVEDDGYGAEWIGYRYFVRK